MEIFQLKNDNFKLKDCYLDLHGLSKVEAQNITRIRLAQIQQDLNKGDLVPSIGDGRNHVVKVVCGAGKHSSGRAVLKYAIANFLVRVK